jgi:hypothetical protein
MDGFNQVRSASELLAERAMERVLDLVVQSIDVDALVSQVDIDTLVQRVDVNAIVEKIDVNALLDQVDLNRLIARIDIETIVRHTDLGAVVSMSSGHEVGRAVDIVRAQAVTLDRRIDHWVRRLLRRRGTGLAAPPALRDAGAAT